MSTGTTSSGRPRAVDQIALLRPRGAAWDKISVVVGSTWVVGLLVTVATWSVSFTVPLIGLDPSWWAGLYIAAHRGMHFGTEVIFTYGPLGFLGLPWLWYGNLAVLAFLYQATLHLALCVSLVWALRRTLPLALAALGAFLVVVVAPSMDVPVALAAVWCIAALTPTAPDFARPLVLFGGAILGATETLIEFRPGPVVIIMCAITLVALPTWRRDLPIFVGTLAVVFASLWFAAGQGVGNIGAFVSTSWQVVAGYSQAMGLQASSRLDLVLELVIGAALIAGAALTVARGRARVAATAVVTVACFSLFKEGAVRADSGHVVIFFSSALALTAALAVGRWRFPAIAVLVAILVFTARVDGQAGLHPNYNPITNVKRAGKQVQLLFSPGQRNLEATFFFLIKMEQRYAIPNSMLNLLRGRTVDADPWEIGAAWAYKLDWDPLPVLQDYNAYTSALDRRDARALDSSAGPERILRENPALVDPVNKMASIDGRFPAWDPPAKSLAMLCNYQPLQTDSRWQVLGKVPNRCGAPQLIGSLHTRYGSTITIPQAPTGSVVYAKIAGAGDASLLERIRTFLYRAPFEYVVVNGGSRYRLVPGTADDGLVMDAAPGVDYPSPFALSPGAGTIRLVGESGSLRIDLYTMQVRPR